MPKSGPTVIGEAAAGTPGAEGLLYYRKYSSLYSPLQCLLILSTKKHSPLYAAELDHLEGNKIASYSRERIYT